MKALSILIAEDEALTRADLRGMLERGGHIVCGECANGRRAVELTRQLSPDMALLDVMMPEMDGLETAKILHTLNIPVVMVTAYSQPNIVNRAENVYVSGYIVKPVSEQNLLATIRIAHARWNDMQHVRRELAETKEQLQQQKTIAHAKAIIASQKSISEMAAHRQLIQEAMRQRITLVELAENIVDEHKAVNGKNNLQRSRKS